MRYDRAEALRYMGTRKDDIDAGVLADMVYLKLRNEVQARYILQRYSCNVDEGGITLECGMRFISKDIARHLRGCGALFILAATLGSRIDTAIRRLTMQSVAEGAAAQAVAAALIEGYCDEIQEKAETGGLKQRSRFSPGYGDWSIVEQKKIFELLNCPKKVGITLTEGLMMVPSKSVTAVIGLAEDSGGTVSKCSICVNNDCAYRKE
ncbi:MAG: Vitamin B12 dependent methionine synthase activation subunit [Phascolarctobacterium sp.]|nr:Vitamin B12 dependent methionine synthase activation subunit [Phascolarctobacterium sp.]